MHVHLDVDISNPEKTQDVIWNEALLLIYQRVLLTISTGFWVFIFQ